MKNISIIIVFAICIIFSGCVVSPEKPKISGVKEKSLTPYQNKIKGELGDYLEISGNAKAEIFKQMSNFIGIKVPIKSISTTNKDFYGLRDGNCGSLYLDLLDKDGAPVSGWESIPNEFSEDGKIANLLKHKGEEDWIIFQEMTPSTGHGWDTYEVIPEKICSFSIIHKPIQEEDKKSQKETAKASIGSENWDKVLKEYEDYIKEYIKLLKSAKDGDVSAISKYTDFYNKATDLQNELENAGDQMTSKQAAKFVKLQAELIQAANQ